MRDKIFVERVEIELSSHCNAACPGCLRTHLLNEKKSFSITHLNEEFMFERFLKVPLKGFLVFLCGVLGDPLMHPKIFKIIQWFIRQGCTVCISTNASLRSKAFWKELGELSSKSQKLYIHFAVDGFADTNPLYRVNTNYSLIKRNMKVYSKMGGLGKWVFIEFNHNRHQKEEVRRQAGLLNLEFAVSRAVRNTMSNWMTTVKQNSEKKDNKIYHVKHTEGTLHSKVESYKKIINDQVEKWDPTTIHCKYLHKKDFFLASDGTVWPCCYLWDEYTGKKTSFHKKIDDFFPLNGWNSIYKNDFDHIFENDFYQSLSNLWEKNHNRFEKRCYVSCGEKGLLRTQFSSN